MAKSIRSKWKRKCRAIKRIRYGEKELERLKKTIANDPYRTKKEVTEILAGVEDVANVKTPSEVCTSDMVGAMDMDEIQSEFNPKTLRDKNGAYPVWLHPRKIKAKKKSKNKRKKKSKKVKRNN